MGDLLVLLIPFLLVDLVNPVLLAGCIFALGSAHPFRAFSILLASYFVCYLGSGLFIALGLVYLQNLLKTPLYVDYIIEGILALLLFYMAWKISREGDPQLEKKLHVVKPMSSSEALTLGFTVNLIGLPFALPYLGAIDQILKSGVYLTATFLILVIYNLLYILPFALLGVVRVIYREKSDQIFTRINRSVHRFFVKGMPWILLLLGLLLVEDFISFFLGYREHSFLSLGQ